MQATTPELTISGQGVQRTLRSRVLQSPLAGISDQVFRKLVRRWAPEALLFTEMVNANRLEQGYGYYKLDEISHEEGPIAVQIFDHRPKVIVEAAKKAENAGAFLVDINMGCPVKKIARKGGGSALIKEPELAERIISAVADSIQIPISVKTRLGWSEDQSFNLIEFTTRLQNAGAQLLTLHGRTRTQGFSGKADWGAIAKVKSALKIPVIANGDIYNANDALHCLKMTGADGVMIGRGSLGCPWIVGQIDCELQGNKAFSTPTPKEIVSITLEHLQGLLKQKGEHGLLVARKHMNWTCKGFPGAEKLRHHLLRAQTSTEAIALLENQLSRLN